MRKIFTFFALFTLLSLVMISLLTGCKAKPRSAIADYDYSQMQLIQLEDLYEGQPIAVMTTSLGVIKVALYPEYAPNTVANFIDRINEGFYNDSLIMNIQNEAICYAGVNSEGVPKTLDDNGESLMIENEYSVNLWPFKGAFGTFGRNHGFSDSRFFMVNEEHLTDEQFGKLREIKLEDGTQMLPDELLQAFKEVGCVVELSGFFTIFGQTIEGIEVLEAIALSKVDKNQRPVQDIKIINVELVYHE